MTELINTEYAQNECSICYDELGTKNTCTTPCGHHFCFNCMMGALNHNNTCPCCRSTLREDPVEEDSDGDESEDDEFEWNPYDEDTDYMTGSSGRITGTLQSGIVTRHYEYSGEQSGLLYNVKNDDQYATPEVIAKKIQDAGYTTEDIVALWLQRVQRSKPKYNNNNFINKMISDIDDIIITEDDQQLDRSNELEMMGEEDHRTIERENMDTFDHFPDLNLNLLFSM